MIEKKKCNHDEFVFGEARKQDEPVKHTPGPWMADGRAVVGREDQLEICVCTVDDDIQVAEAGANARLISAAPELLAALIAMKEAFVRHPGNMDERHHALTLADASISKAEGRD